MPPAYAKIRKIASTSHSMIVWSYMKSGFLLIDKPVDWTSHDVVGYIRGVVNKGKPRKEREKVGHSGTLDPFATGLLILGIGRAATKRLDEFKALPKTYIATVQLGATSDTQDKTGEITQVPIDNFPTRETIVETLQIFLGKQQQIPPMYSAKKIAGKKLYELARKGEEVERQPNEIEIFDITLTDWDEEAHQFTFSCTVSAGTYVRTICHDLGEKLDTGAYCEALRRTSIGDYSVEDAAEPKSLDKESIEQRLTNATKTA